MLACLILGLQGLCRTSVGAEKDALFFLCTLTHHHCLMCGHSDLPFSEASEHSSDADRRLKSWLAPFWGGGLPFLESCLALFSGVTAWHKAENLCLGTSMTLSSCSVCFH